MNFKWILFGVTLLLCIPVSAQFGRDEIKKSKTVKDEITLGVKDENNLDLYIDTSQKTEKTLNDKDYFQVKSNEFRVYAIFENPLQYIYRTSQKELDDELFIASREFLNNAASYIQQVQAASVRGKRARPVINAPSSATLEPKLVELFLLVKAQDNSFFTNNALFWNAMGALDLSETNDSIAKIYNNAFTDLQGIKSISTITAVLNSNKIDLKKNQGFLDDLDKRYNDLKTECSKITFAAAQAHLSSHIDNVIKEIGSDIEVLKTTKKDIDSKYDKIKELFDTIEKEKHKFGEDKFLIAKPITVNKSKRTELTIVLEKVTFNEAEKSIKIDNSKTFLVNIRKKTTFIPVLSSGVLYTNVSFPQFGTDTNEPGETIISQTEDEDNELAIAAYLNLYLNNSWDVPAFFQFGVGPSKEKPLFFLGGGIELAPKFTLSTGAVFTWYPKLNDLSVGDVVGGSSIINDDISFEFNTKPRFYFGLSIDITNK